MNGVWNGSWHCGAVRFRVETEVKDTTSCDCSLCSRRSATMIQVHETGMKILAGEDNLGLYQWNTKVARHYFCRTCGIYPFHRKRAAPDSSTGSMWPAWTASIARPCRIGSRTASG